MKTSRVWAATGFLMMTVASGTLHAQSPAFTLVNDTAFSVLTVHYWPSTEDDNRGPDRLGTRTIKSGQSYRFSPNHDECWYDIRVTLAGGDKERQWTNVNLCDLNTLTLRYSYVDRVLLARSE